MSYRHQKFWVIAYAALVLVVSGSLLLPCTWTWIGTLPLQQANWWYRMHFEGGPPVRRALAERVVGIEEMPVEDRPEAYQAFFDEHGLYYNLLENRAHVLRGLGRPEEALNDLNKAIALYESQDGWGKKLYYFPMWDSDYPFELDFLRGARARAHEEAGELERAFEDYQALPTGWFAHLDMGRVQAKRGNWVRAMREFCLHVEQQPGHSYAMRQVQRTVLTLGQPRNADAQYRDG